MELAVTDLFVVGLGLDLVGGWLLARGLIARPGVIVHRHTSYWGSDAPGAYAAAEDRVDGVFGVGSLMLGFLLQAVGYVLDLARGESGTHSESRALTALVLLVIVVALTLGVWRRVRAHRVRTLLIEMSHWTSASAAQPPIRHDKADPSLLVIWGGMTGKARGTGEDDRAYAMRVFRLADKQVGAGA